MNRLHLVPLLVLGAAVAACASRPPRVHPAPKPTGESRTGSAEAPPAADASGDLAKKLQNPVADLISVPFQLNLEHGAGESDGIGRTLLNIQPVIPIALNEDWNVISRTIVPVVTQDEIVPGTGDATGLGDTLQSLFVSPREPSGWIWGVGPAILFPTATDDLLGGGKWAAGPTAVALTQKDGWTAGLLANHLWSFAGDDSRRDVSATFLQPFLSYTFPTFTTVGLNTESTYDWESEQWTVPVQLQVAQLLKFGDQPVQIALGGRRWFEGPDAAPDWSVRLTLTILLPAGP